jgi:hypothetical protein
MIAVLMPLFFLHTIVGGLEFFKADKMSCRVMYQGEVVYIINFMFACSMCFVFVLLFLCVMLPIWLSELRHRRRNVPQYERPDALNEQPIDFAHRE